MKENELEGILTIFGRWRQRKKLLEVTKGLKKEKRDKILEKFDSYSEFYSFSWIIRIVGIILWYFFFDKNLYLGVLIFLVFIPIAFFINSSRKKKIFEEIKNN